MFLAMDSVGCAIVENNDYHNLLGIASAHMARLMAKFPVRPNASVDQHMTAPKGLATPTEAGAILVLYRFFCALIFGRITFREFVQCLIDSSVLSTMILMIMIVGTDYFKLFR